MAEGAGSSKAKPQQPALSPEELGVLLGLIKGADSVELKLSVPEESRRGAVAALGMDPLDAEVRQVVFFDTPDLTLDKAGVVVRARRIQRKPHDSVVKLRPVVPDELPATLRRSPSFGVEVDAMPGGFVCSASMKGVVDTTHINETLAGRLPIRKLFSKAQRALYTEHAPAGIKLDDLSPLGPITLLKLKFNPKALGRRLVAELWTFPDGSRILELSTKCLPNEAFQVAAEARAFLGSRGLDLSGVQQTKTRTALEMFSAELRKAAAE